MMIGAIAATGAERKAITTGSEACARLRLMEKATAIPAASTALAANPIAAAVSVKPVWPSSTFQLRREGSRAPKVAPE